MIKLSSFYHWPATTHAVAVAALLLGGTALTAATLTAPAVAMAQSSLAPAVMHRTVKIRGIDMHYREAGPANGPVLLLLHGFPSSSHMFRDLIPQLAGKYRVIAPDYPGFGYSGAPSLGEFDYSFGGLGVMIDEFTQQVGAKNYALYMQDYGGPVGFRLALKHPERVKALIIQNATVHVEGWNPDVVKQFAPFWKERNAETEKPIRAFLKPETTKWQYTHGATRPDRLSPDAWSHDQSGLDRPGNDALQLQYLWNYQDNVAQYPAWQNYLKTQQPPTLIVWGKNDPFFTLAGVEAIKTLLPKAKVTLYDAGHFALETHAGEIGAEISDFLGKTLIGKIPK